MTPTVDANGFTMDACIASISFSPPLLIVADAAPPEWKVKLPDLRSRLAASPIAAFGAPDDELMRLLLAHLFERRNVDARPDLIDWLASRIERSHITVTRTVDALDQEAMERRKRLSIPLARTTLTEAGLILRPQLALDLPLFTSP